MKPYLPPIDWSPVLVALLAAVSIGCDPRSPAPASGDSGATPTADAEFSCAPEFLTCYSQNPDDEKLFCICDTSWSCNDSRSTCERDLPVPWTSTWSCTWSKLEYSCTKKGTNDESPTTGRHDWSCVWTGSNGLWRCTKALVPMPPGTRNWSCTVDSQKGKLRCTLLLPQ